MKRILAFLAKAILPSLFLPWAVLASDFDRTGEFGRWTPNRAWSWYNSRPWLIGCNFLPSTAVNDVEMWQKETFDAKTIDRELGWAEALGFNTVRVFVNYAVWEADPKGLKRTFGRFLKIADKHDLSVLVILFDDCFKPEPRVGRQDEPEPGVHNSQWVQSPGEKRRNDLTVWPQLEHYVKDMVGSFGADKRVLAWELYNEPSQSLPLVEAAFQWARAAKPSQPITTTLFGNAEMQKRILELSDVICFHEYGSLPAVKAQITNLSTNGRPVLCTEWMARTLGSRFETHLPYFKTEKIACWNWGFVAGRTQTYFPWGAPKGGPEPKSWFHDILRRNGTPYSQREFQFIRVTTGKLPASALPQRQMILSTAEQSPVTWRYTLEKPADDWREPSFDDTKWKQGAAPFGTAEPEFARKPNTLWTNAEIWMRREFNMPVGRVPEFTVSLYHDEDTEVYLNGVLACQASGYNASYAPFDVAPEAQAALNAGRNTIAIHCRQTTGGQYIDLGLDGWLAIDRKAPTEKSSFRD